MSSPPRPSRCIEALLLAATLLFASSEAGGACEARDGESGVVASIIDGDTLVLDSGLVVRLDQIAAPKAPLGLADGTPWPAAGQAEAALKRLALGQAVQLRYAGARRDRHGRARADVIIVTEDGETISLSEALLAAGEARVVPTADDSGCAVLLMKLEQRAAQSGLGLWRDPYYAIRAATDPDLVNRQNQYDLVEGRIVSVGVRGAFVYLDFGRDWSTDFTATLVGAAKKALLANGSAPEALTGRRVRVRGFVEDHGGPSIRVDIPAAIEFLDGADGVPK